MTTILSEAMEKPKVEDFVLPGSEPENSPDPVSEIKLDFSALWELLKTEAGPGELEDYQKIPLSLGSTGLARILWGISGFIGYALKDLNRNALIQIVTGIFEWQKERKSTNA